MELLEALLELLKSEAVLNLILGLVGVVWTAIKASDWWKAKKESDSKTLYELVELAIEKVYQDYVRKKKEEDDPETGSPAGTLSDDQRKEARDLAIDMVLEFGKKQGIDVEKLIDRDRLEALVSLAVTRAKERAAVLNN